MIRPIDPIIFYFFFYFVSAALRQNSAAPRICAFGKDLIVMTCMENRVCEIS